MLSRRSILLGAAAGSALLGLNVMRAAALSTEPMAPDDLKALALACDGVASHAQLVTNARLMLDDEIKRGVKPASASETVVCPLCHCSLQVLPDIGF